VTRSLDDIADRLYALPPATFVSARDDEVSQARTAGDRDAAKAIGGLRRPTVAAWMVNLLALGRPDELSDLMDIGAAMRAAQSSLKGDELRDLAARRRKAVSRLVRAAAGLATDAGAARSSLPVGEVETTLNAAVADEAIARDVQSGRLVKAIQYDGFGEMPRPDLQLVPGGRTAPPANKSSVEKVAPASKQPAPAKAAPGGKATKPGGKAPKPAQAPEPEMAKISSAALARRRLAARKLRQAEVGLSAARNAFRDAEQALRAAEETEKQARAAFESAERDLQE
jgi:hypothetical protein